MLKDRHRKSPKRAPSREKAYFGSPAIVWDTRLGSAMIVITLFATSAAAAEPTEAFLRELTSRGYYNLGLKYLERLEASPLVDASFIESIPYRQGEIYILSALQQQTLMGRQRELDRAQRAFETFLSEHSDHSLIPTARGRLGDIAMERARLKLSEANQPTTAPPRRDELLNEARQLFDNAIKVFAKHESHIRTRLEEIPKGLSPTDDAELINERDRLRSQYVQAQFVGAMGLYEQAQTYEKGSNQRQKRLEDASEAFKVVAEKYRRRVAGLTAILFQGRCQQALGDPRGALAYFEDLLTLPDGEPSLRPLKTKALLGAIECWIDDEINQPETARQRAVAWIDQQRPNERRDDDWLMIKLLLAETYQKLIDSGPGSGDRARLTREARRLAMDVAKQQGRWQERAQTILADLGHTTQPVAQQQPIANFADAMIAARDSLARRQVAAQTVAMLQRRVAEAGPTNGRVELERSLKEAQSQLDQIQTDTLQILRQTQDLVTDETPIEQINQSRFYLCLLYYHQQDYYSAAVLAEFLSSRFPSTDEGRRSAAVCLASLVRLYDDGKSPWAPTLFDRMTAAAKRIANQWAGQPEADDALATLITIAAQQGDAQAAVENLGRMSSDSPKRAAAELTVGQILWNRASLGQGEDDAEQEMRRAVEMLKRGLEGATSPSSASITASLIVAQHLVSHGEARQAIDVLEHPVVGPKSLADQQHSLINSPAILQRIYLLSMMAYIGALPDSNSPSEFIGEALAALQRLQDPNVSGSNSQQLASSYVMLARNLQDQLQATSPSKRGPLIEAFSQLLERASRTTRELNVVIWAADSYGQLGEAARSMKQSGQDAQTYFERSVETFGDLLKRTDRGEYTLTVKERFLLETRFAIALRRAGQFAQATDQFAAILRQQPNQVHVQMEAAKTLQQWAGHGRYEAYQMAITGDRLDPKTNRNTIWGYGRIAKLIAGKRGLQDLFYEARYELALCRYQLALQQPTSERMQTLRQAEQDVTMTARLYPELGGDESREKYDRLLQQIQESLGKRPVGLKS